MPSPLAHIAAGYAIFEFARSRVRDIKRSNWCYWLMLLGFIAFSLLPDLDSVAGIAMSDFGRYHNNLTHSFAAGLIASIAAAVVSAIFNRKRIVMWTSLAFVCYALHVLMDYFTCGRGVMIFWPLSGERWTPPLKLFYGLHWSQGWISPKHIWTFLNEAIFIAAIIGLTSWLHKAPLPNDQ